jgi:hypothetical protein
MAIEIPEEPIRSETVRLYGSATDWNDAESPVRALLYGQMMQRVVGVTDHYLSDMFHDAEWITEYINGPTTFYWMVRQWGTNIGESARIQVNVGPGDGAVLYRVHLKAKGGEWFVTFHTLMEWPRKTPTPYTFLDVSTCMITNAEMNTIESAPTTVMTFDEGAWVNVKPAAMIDDEEQEDAEWADFPNLRAVLKYAREHGARYVMLDADGLDRIPGLPTFTW